MSSTADTAGKPVVVPGVEDLHGTEPIRKGAMSVYVYQTPIRLWHWATAASIVVLCVTGYFIGRPLPSTPGEASDQFLLGYIRAAHFIAGYVLAIGIVARTYWAIVGNKHAKQIYTVPLFTRGFWGDILFQIRWYLFLEKVPRKHVGHNPLARVTMFLLFLNCVAFQVLTGFALYGEGAGLDSWQFQLFGWVIPLFGGSMQVHTAHHVAMWVMILFVMTHVYAAIREDIMGRASILSTMISGWRNFRDTRD